MKKETVLTWVEVFDLYDQGHFDDYDEQDYWHSCDDLIEVSNDVESMFEEGLLNINELKELEL